MPARALEKIKIMKTKFIALTILLASAIWSPAQTNWTDSTNYGWASTTIDLWYIGTGVDTNGYTFKQIAGTLNHDVTQLEAERVANSALIATNTANIASNTASLSPLLGGITTNLQFTDQALVTPTTNTLYFTNGILRAVTSP